MNHKSITDEELLYAAKEARKGAYSPYSNISVGAALLTGDGKIYTGANIENASFTPTVCAERVAFFKAISEGEKNFDAIAIYGGKNGESATTIFTPCGVCRQVMSEFCDENFRIIVSDGTSIKCYPLSELFPHGFDKNSLGVII